MSLYRILFTSLSVILSISTISTFYSLSHAAPVDCSSLDRALKSTQHRPKYKYRRARKILFTKLAPQLDDGDITTLYSARRRSARRGTAPQGLNCEHLLPRAWMGSKRHKNYKYIEADLHNLFPSEIKTNSRRGHLAFGAVTGQTQYRIGIDSTIGESAQGEEVIEPRPQVRGDIARALLYMALRWDIPIAKFQDLNTLQRWSKLDPPSQREERRDQLIAKLQGNHNPFVSCPQLVNDAINTLSHASPRGEINRHSNQEVSKSPLDYPWLKKSDQPSKHQSSDTLAARIFPPPGSRRISVKPQSFASWLRGLPLLPGRSKVLLYDGSLKGYQGAHHAVINIDIGDRDLQQCADAVIRLRAEYLFARQAKRLTPKVPISFNYTTGDKIPYQRWQRGDRPRVKEYKKNGRRRWKVEWRRRRAKADKSYPQFRRYLNNIFSYAGTASLSKELSRRPPHDIRIGDLYLRGGFPGHAVIVVDVAEHPEYGTLMLLAQSYMPAQSPHILKNLEEPSLSPWFKVPRSGQLITPEWTFSATNLYRFKGKDLD